MRTLISRIVLLGSVLTSLTALACEADIRDNKADIHDNEVNIDDANVELETSADVDNVEAGSAVPCTVKADNVVLVEPNETPAPEEAEAAGHFEFYLDTTDSPAILVTAQTEVDIQIPESTEPGDHKIICVLKKHDGTPTEVESEIDIKVKAKISTSS